MPLSAQVEADRQLVERCLNGDSAAWSQLYQQFHERLLATTRSALGSLASDSTLVDEVGARVWYAIVRNDYELLARYDVSRGCQLSTFLGIIAKREAKQLLRSERRRRTREHVAARPDIWLDHADSEPGTAAEAEFLATLTPSERAFYVDVLVATPNGNSVKKYSPSNAWQLTHRVREKLSGFLFGTTS